MTIEFDPLYDDISLIKIMLDRVNMINEAKEIADYNNRQLREMELTDKVATTARPADYVQSVFDETPNVEPDTPVATRKKRRGSKVPPAPPAAEIPKPPVDETPSIDPELTLVDVTKRLTNSMMNGAFSFGDLKEILQANGVENLTELAKYPEKWRSILELLGA